jgi:ribosomal protein S7
MLSVLNHFIKKGKKSLIEKKILKSLKAVSINRIKRIIKNKTISQRTKRIEQKARFVSNHYILKKILRQVSPSLIIKILYKSGRKVRIPVLIKKKQRIKIGMRWFTIGIHKKIGKSFEQQFYNGICTTLRGKGYATRKKKWMKKKIKEKRSFFTYRW